MLRPLNRFSAHKCVEFTGHAGTLPRGAGTSHKHRPVSPWWVCGVIVRMITGPWDAHKDPLVKGKGMREATWLAALCGETATGLP